MKRLLPQEKPPKPHSRRCNRCKMMFETEGIDNKFCPNCQRQKNEQYMIVRALVREFPGITALQVHEVTEVPIETIIQYIDAGDLQVVGEQLPTGELAERIGIMIKRARTMKELYHPVEAKDGLDDMKMNPDEDQRKHFKWVLADKETVVKKDIT